MKPIIKQLLSEMIYFRLNRKCYETDTYVKVAYENLSNEILFTRIRNLLSWLDLKMQTPMENLEKYFIYEDFMEYEDFTEVYAEFKSLFEHISVFNELFVLKEEHIEFNSSLAKSEIVEIYDYVKENNIIKHRTLYYRSNED